MDPIKIYLTEVEKRYRTGIAREHAYRGDLQHLLDKLIPKDVLVINEPARVKCGAPDYILTKKNIPVGYIEAKDVGKPLNSKDYKEQFDRYRGSLHNLIFTDYLNFWLYRNGEKVATVTIAEIENKKIKAKPENFDNFINLIKDFASYSGQTITSAQKLSKMMAGKAKLLATIIGNALTSDEDEDADSTLKDQMKAFEKILIHDIDPKGFADIYAQTIAYGMFAARLHDETLDNFSRHEAAELIPQSNPFLRKLFQYIAGYDLDERIRWIVDELADIFRATDVAKLLKDFGKATQKHDPMIHFYETFLAEYDPKLRKSRGVWYTPEPVVNFIVRAVDDILKTEFNLKDGLADTSKTTIELDSQTVDARTKTGYKRYKREIHKVQILDPATGTGTFLAEVIKQVHTKFEGQQGIWSNYVENELVPRLNGFEILMASYAMAHLKLDLLLQETGYKPKKQKRLNVYLTNSLEEYHPDTGTLFASWLSNEASAANHIKRDTPVMVVMGNPPYAVSSSNKGDWIQELIKDYKKGLNEKKLNLDDDYIKFIRYGQHYIEKNGEGILAYISNNSFIDGITHRKMRKGLLEVFDKIYILDLHGNSKRREKAPDGGKDENVFDIMQGVSINLFVRNNRKKKRDFAEIFHYDLYGKRDLKYDFLIENNIQSVGWKQLEHKDPYFFFIPKDYKNEEEYSQFFGLTEILPHYNSGIQTKNDKLAVQYHQKDLRKIVEDFQTLNESELAVKYSIKNSSGWKIEKAKIDLIRNKFEYCDILYRPFDTRKTLFTGSSGGFIGRPRFETNRNIVGKENISLITVKQQSSFQFQHAFVTKSMIDGNTISMQTREYNYIFPLYLYPEDDKQQKIGMNEAHERIPNLDMKIVGQIAEELNLKFISEKEDASETFSPIDIIDYIYAVLHSPKYREKYKEFLKINFPRIPYPEDKKTFWNLVKLGGELRETHLLEDPSVEHFITTYPADGDNKVTRRSNKKDFEITDADKRVGRIWINDDQYFDQVPVKAWEFYIGGYQPAQKWLKDRFGRTLSFDDIRHYQKIIVSLMETDRIMTEIDDVLVF